MDIKALEDFICLAETGSFSKAADKRFITQPAFSRRIKSLENWFGTDLVDRSQFPTRLTVSGEKVLTTAQQIIAGLSDCKIQITQENRQNLNQLKFSMPHNLSMGFFPKWRQCIEPVIGDTMIQVVTGNIHDTAQLLDSNSCDLVIFYQFDQVKGFSFNENKFKRIFIGEDKLIPVCKPDDNGQPVISIESNDNSKLPYIGWSPPTLVNHSLELLFQENEFSSRLQLRYENQLAAALRQEVLTGTGFAWLPESLISDELERSLLVRSSHRYDLSMQIGLACNKTNMNATVSALWAYLEERE